MDVRVGAESEHALVWPGIIPRPRATCQSWRANSPGGYRGPGRSPDRGDAMAWALTELMLGKRSAEPRIRLL